MVWYATKKEHVAAHQWLMRLEALDELRTMTMFSRQGANAMMQHLNTSGEARCWDGIDIVIRVNYDERGSDFPPTGDGPSVWFVEYGRHE